MSAYVSIRQHTSAYVSTPGGAVVADDAELLKAFGKESRVPFDHLTYVSIRQHTSAYGSIRQHTAAYGSIRQHTAAYESRVPFDHRRRGLVVFPPEVALRCEIPVGRQRAEALVHVVVVVDDLCL